MSLAPALARRVRTGGRIVLSGILDAQADAVMTVYRRWFNIGVCESDDGWVRFRELAPEARLTKRCFARPRLDP